MNRQEIKEFLKIEIEKSLKFLKVSGKKKTLLGNVMANKARHYSDEIKNELSGVIKPNINDNLMSRIYCLLNDIEEYPKCKVCGKEIKRFKSYFDGWYDTCCKECANIDKYGVPCTASVKSVREKMKTTIIRNHGALGWGAKDIHEKCEITKRNKYGDNLEDLVEKARQTCLKRYGVDHIMKSDIGVQKYLASRDYHSPEYIQKCKEQFKQNNIHEKMTRSRLNNMYDKLVEATKNDVEFLFSKDEYKSFCKEINGTRKVIKYKFRCKHCNTIFESSLRNLKRDTILHCPTCKKSFKSWTQHLLKIELEQTYSNFTFQEDRIGILSGRKELDIYCPEINLGIEYNGLNWHAEQYNNFTQFKHYNKWKECFDSHVNFLAFWSDELEKHNKRIKTMISSFFVTENITADISKLQIQELQKQKAKLYAIDNFYKCFVINYLIKDIAYFYINDNNELIDFWFIDNFDYTMFNFICKELYIERAILENRFLSYYIKYMKNYRIVKSVNPRFYIFDGHRSSFTKDENEKCESDRIWNYGYQIVELYNVE